LLNLFIHSFNFQDSWTWK